MEILICSPYREDKNLGRAYNETMRLLPDDWWACFKDIDSLFLTPECGSIMAEYVRLNPDAGILTCLTNRLSPLSSKQLLGGKISEETDIRVHIKLAQIQKRELYTTREIHRDISGVLMLISKKTWMEMPFSEDKKCLGVDTEYNRRIRGAGKKILRMNGLYIFHTYRMEHGITNKNHLL